MGESARSEVDVPSSCEKCGGRRELDRERGDAKSRLRCTGCSDAVDVAIVPALGRWTVVDPEGVVRQFASWHELIGSLPLSSAPLLTSGPRSTRSSSAAALLDVTRAASSTASSSAASSSAPASSRLATEPKPARLSLVPADDPPPLPLPLPLPRVPVVDEAIEEVMDDDVQPASDDGRSARAFGVPSALRVSIAPPLPARASAHPSAPSTPPLPRGGSLKTLPPPPRHSLPAPPPPTIDVDSGPLLARAAPAASSNPRAGDTQPSASVSPDLRHAAEPPARARWLLPVTTAALLTVAFAYTRTPAPALAPASAVASASAPALAPAPAPALASAPASASASAPVSASASPVKPLGDSQLSLPDVLARAALARRSGDAAHAKALLERALVLSPGNAEAYGLLGDLARSQGDPAGAKASYERALATSPSYFPALLGLADTEWDLGEREAARRRYLGIVAQGRPMPDRVRERALGTAATSPPAATPTAEPPEKP